MDEDDYDNLTEIKYTGQGGRNSKGKMVKDQELIRGNKALTLNIQKNSCKSNPRLSNILWSSNWISIRWSLQC